MVQPFGQSQLRFITGLGHLPPLKPVALTFAHQGRPVGPHRLLGPHHLQVNRRFGFVVQGQGRGEDAQAVGQANLFVWLLFDPHLSDQHPRAAVPVQRRLEVVGLTPGYTGAVAEPGQHCRFNSTVTLTATASPGWGFAGWSGDLGGSSNPTNITIDGNKVITATFNNNPPVANAGPNQAVETNTNGMLDGGGSYDEDPNQTLTYSWLQTGGLPVALSNSTAVSLTFTAPANRTVLTFTLVVTDSFGLASLSDTTVVTVQAPEIAIAMQDNTTAAAVGETITYTYSLANTGDVDLNGVNAVDDRLGLL